MGEFFVLYCSQPPGCICHKCLYYWSSRCPHGGCYDKLRAQENPYDKAHPDEPPRTAWSNWKEDQAYWCRGGIFYQTHDCNDFVEYDESNHVVKECLEAMISVYQDGYIRCSLVETVGCEECMKRFNEKLDKEEVEEVPKQTYYTKCGRTFQKNSTASVTGYSIDENDKECADCPFQVDVKEGWPPVHKRWECRAGSEKPNQKDSWSGSLEDKNTIHIKSLHNDFLEEVLEYCKSDPELVAAYNQDLEDCRRVISVSCSGNKKGIAAKKALVERFFPVERPISCRYCTNFEAFKKVNHAGSSGNCHKNGGQYPVYIPDSKCKDFKPADTSESTATSKADKPVSDWPSRNCIDCQHCTDDKQCSQGVFKNTSIVKISDNCKACPKFLEKQKTESETCAICGHSEDWGESVEYIKCAEGGKRKDVRKKQAACANYIPSNTSYLEMGGIEATDPEQQLDELLNDSVQEEQVYIYRGLV